MQFMPSTCFGVLRDNGRWAGVGWSGAGGGDEGRVGSSASFCKVAAVSVKPDTENYNLKLYN